MRIAHFATVAPHRCGLYGTAKDLMEAEKRMGYEVGLVDAYVEPTKIFSGEVEDYPRLRDEAIDIKSLDWANKADVIIRHSLLSTKIQNLDKPLIMALHGRPESSYRLEVSKVNMVVSYLMRKANIDKRYKGFIVFWPEYMFVWSSFIPDEKLFYVPVPVDLNYYNPDYKTKLDLSKNGGSPNILIADIWREDVTPFNLIFAAALFRQKYCSTAKIHIVALQKVDLAAMLPFLCGLKKSDGLGFLPGHILNIMDYYAMADIVLTPHVIATRAVREPLACGVPIVAGSGNRYTPYTANPMDINAFAEAINQCWQDYRDDPIELKRTARKTAEIAFNLENTGKAMKSVLERILE